jgi:exopolysaccharide biosynthesis polyprenyl glycosylphosphotransferase
MNLLFRGLASDYREETVFYEVGASQNDGGFLSEKCFLRALSVEEKRVERSRKLLLLMLLDAKKLWEGQDGKRLLLSFLSVLSSSSRETDVMGWYKKGSIIGLIFTEIEEEEKEGVRNAIFNRISRLMHRSLTTAHAQRISISLNFFPESAVIAPHDHDDHNPSKPDPFERPNSRKIARAAKRGIDLTGSTLALIALAPLFGLIALLVRLTSKGPVFFRQRRVGRGGRTFDCLKFRSMHVSNDPAIHKEYVQKLISGQCVTDSESTNAGAVYKIRDDPRVTRVGRLLRKTSFDELPQFWNVFKGEMSLVGPRPAIPYEIECYDIWHRRRVLDVKPGITGLWQISGRSRTTFDEMVRLDLKYARTWSVWLDLLILLKTPRAVVSGEGAY